MKLFPTLAIAAVLAVSGLSANAAPIEFKPEDSAANIASILRGQSGQVVELRLRSGEKVGGKVEKVSANLVHLSQLTGMEFFEAAVSLDSISAVVVRSKSK